MYIDLWHIPLQEPVSDTLADDLLSLEEKARAARFCFPVDRERYLISHTALRLVLAGYCETSAQALMFAKGPAGKPYLINDERVRFNLSHSHQQAVIAVCVDEADLGVDVEYIDAKLRWQGIADLIFTDRERAWIAEVPEEQRLHRFYDIWTRKEAVSKAHGSGFSLNFQTFCTVSDPSRRTVEMAPPAGREWPLATTSWHVDSVPLGGEYACAIACSRPYDGIRRHDFHPNRPTRLK